MRKAVEALISRLFRDPRYVPIGKVDRFGGEKIAFVEVCAVLSPTGEPRGQYLLNQKYELGGRPDGERPYGAESLLDYYQAQLTNRQQSSLTKEDHVRMREESWQYYVRRNFHFLMEDFERARQDAEHNLGLWELIDRYGMEDPDRWEFLRWWPWIERDRAVATALGDVERGDLEAAAMELYRAAKAIDHFGVQHEAPYAMEPEAQRDLCQTMRDHICALTEVLRKEYDMPICLEEQVDLALERGDAGEVERLREEMIRRVMEEG